MYFETQDKLMCSVHSINNLLGENVASARIFKSIAHEIIHDKYHSRKSKVSLNTYKSRMKPNYYHCEEGFFSPDIQHVFIEKFTQYTLKHIDGINWDENDFIQHAHRNNNIHGFLLSVSKKYKNSNNRYNHSISIRVFRDRYDECIVLLDSELTQPFVLDTEMDMFGDYYKINSVEILQEKSKSKIEKQARSLVIDLNSIPPSKYKTVDKFIDIISRSPKLVDTIQKKSREIIDLTGD